MKRFLSILIIIGVLSFAGILFAEEQHVLAVSPWLVLFGLAISLIGGVLAGMIPAWRAAKLQPAEALRRF